MTPPVLDVATKTVSKRRCLVPTVLAATVLLSLSAYAQPISSGIRPASPAVPVPAGDVDREGQSKAASETPFGLLKPEDGTVIPLPPGTTYEDYLTWIASRRGPGYGINSVRLTGVANGGSQLELDIEISIVIHREAEWVRVPLGLSEVVLIDDAKHEHAGGGLFSYESISNDVGRTWSFRGLGEHRLKLKALLPLSVRSGETQMTLTTPANAATTSVNLRLPGEFDVTAVGGLERSTTRTAEVTTFDWVGPGGRIDITWRPVPVLGAPSDLTIDTTFVTTFTGRSVHLRTEQRINASKGKISAVRVHLPEGFHLEGVAGSLYRSHREENVEDGSIATVELVEPTEGLFELTWRGSMSLPADGRIAISGFDLPDVPLEGQSGRILLVKSNGYTVTQTEGSSEVAPFEPAESGTASVATGYAFARQPFRLSLKAEPVPAQFVVKPELEFKVVPGRLDLDGNFEVEVRQGELRDVRLVWPAPEWSINQVRLGPIQEFRRSTDGGSPIDIQVPTTFTPPLRIPIRASRPLEGMTDAVRVPLPRLEATGQQKATASQSEAVIKLRHPKSFRVIARAVGGAMLRPLDDLPNGLPEVGEGERLTMFAAPATVREILIEAQRLQQEITVSTNIAVRPRGENLRVEQRIDYDIANAPLSTVRLMVPESLLAQGLDFTDGSRTDLQHRLGGPASDGLAEVIVELGGAVVGPVSLETQFDVRRPAAANDSAEATIPVLVPSEAPYSTMHLRVARLPRHTLSPGEGWVRFHTTQNDGHERWLASKTVSSIPVRLAPRPNAAANSHSVSRLLLRSVVERDGRVHTVADALIEDHPPSISLRLPQTIEPESFAWRGRKVQVEMFEEREQILVEVPLDAGTGPPVLSVTFKSQMASPPGVVNRSTLHGFRFTDLEVEQTLWRLTLPESQHLFSGPSQYTSRFRWRLDGAIWSRHTDESFRQLVDWFGQDVATVGPEFESGHQYVFSRLGGPEPLSYSAIARSLVVLIGAGVAILIGYAFANGLVPRRRVALGVIAAALLILWAFFPNQIQLFLQPAILGLALVGAAAFAEWILQRRQDRLTTNGPASAVEFVTILPGEESASSPPAAIGSEEPTVVRTGRREEAYVPREEGATH